MSRETFKPKQNNADLVQSIVERTSKTFMSLMDMLGIQFAPRDVPMERRLQTLAAMCWISLLLFGEIVCVALTVLLVRSSYYWVMMLYIFIIARNRDDCKAGCSKYWNWVRDWRWWHYFKDYFPLKLEKTVDLSPEKNYLLCVFPHGVLCTGAYGNFATEAGGFSKIFPGMKSHVLTLSGHFLVPFFRELLGWLGMASASADSIDYLLDSKNGTGRCAVLAVGGAAESLFCHPGVYRVVIKRRKGFVKRAMNNGAPLVPVFSFGETDLYEQVHNPEGSILRRIQEWVRMLTGIAPVIPIGRGIFQYSFGILPKRSKVYTVVGKPMEVARNVDPSEEEVNRVHEEFIKNLTELFETQKYNYLPNPKENKLIIE